MTLSEWSATYRATVTTHRDHPGARLIWCRDRDLPHEALWHLYHLDDYAVTTNTIGVKWLCPREAPCDESEVAS